MWPSEALPSANGLSSNAPAANGRPGRTASHSGRTKSALSWGAGLLSLLSVVALVWHLASARAEPAVRYQTLAVDRGTIAAKVTATGTLSALVTVQVGSQVSGRIASLSADFGSHVTKGQVVATIEPSLFRAAAAQARANYRAATASVERTLAEQVNADRQYVRAKALHAQGLMTGAEFDTQEAAVGVARANVVAARASVAQAKAALDQAELNVRYATIVSPIDGVVISRNVDVGQTVAATLQAPTLFTIAQDLARMQVDTSVAEADIGKVREGMPVSFTVDAYPGRTFKGTVRQVRDNAVTLQNVVTYDAVIDFDNAERLVKPGMTANVTLTYARKENVLRISNVALRYKPDAAVQAAMSKGVAALSAGPNERIVWLLEAGRARQARVRIGISDGTWTEVAGGDVRAGDAAIIDASLAK